MTALRVVGAGLPRTGTTSLKVALEQLTGGRCYHMFEVFGRSDEHVPLWQRVVDGDIAVTDEILADYVAAIDWPASVFWRELADRHPDAVVVLSRRADAATWWRSADRTVWEGTRKSLAEGADDPFFRMVLGLFDRFHPDVDDADGAMAAYDAHLAEVRSTIPAHRLLELEPTDGWAPLCEALGVPVPDEPYPHHNTAAQFRSMRGWE